MAPNQFELAPVYEEANLANDHNQLLMTVMDKIARRHKFRVLLHEKPFKLSLIHIFLNSNFLKESCDNRDYDAAAHYLKGLIDKIPDAAESVSYTHPVRSLSVTLPAGFVDNDLQLCLYTDPQIFDRYQRYRINGEIRRDDQMTVAELNQLRPGDYVVHILSLIHI